MTKPFRSYPFLFITLACAGAHAEGTSDEIVVSAMRAPTPLAETGSAVTIITAETLELRQYAFVADALRDAAGVTLARNGGVGGAASVRLRGASSGQTLVVIDGAIVNDTSAPQGGFNFADLDANNIERIEILRGPQSMLYGADAIGGVIVITSRKSGGARAYVEGGSRDTFRGGVSAGVAEGESYARLSFDGLTTGGVSRASSGTEADGYKLGSATFAGGLTLSNHWRADLNLRGGRSRAEIDGFPPPFYVFGDTEEIEKATSHLASLRLSHDYEHFSGGIGVSWSDTDRHDRDGDFETFSAKGDRLTIDYVGVYDVSEIFRLIGGGEWERTAAKTSGVDETAEAGAGFVVAEAKPVDAVTLSVGVRRDEFSNFEGATTARAAVVWRLDNATRLRGSWGEGFRAPSLFELNYDQYGVTPNPGLKPERASGFDVGVDHDFELGRVAVTLFRTAVKDQIDFDLDNYGYYNIATTRSKGVEVEGVFAITKRAELDLTYGFAGAVDRETGLQLLRQPKHKGTATLNVAATDRLTFGASATFNGRERDTPAANDAFARLDLRIAWSLNEKLELYARVENITDTTYEDVSGYGEPGASVFAGIRARL